MKRTKKQLKEIAAICNDNRVTARCKKTGQFKLWFTATPETKDVADKLQELAGGMITTGLYTNRKGESKNNYYWCLRAPAAAELAEGILPYLTEDRAQEMQADLDSNKPLTLARALKQSPDEIPLGFKGSTPETLSEKLLDTSNIPDGFK